MRVFILSFAFVLFTAISVAQVPEIEDAQKNSSLATIIIYRTPDLYASLRNGAIFTDGDKACKLSNKKFMIYQQEPGELEIQAQIGGLQLWPKKMTNIEFPVEAGNTYYIKSGINASFMQQRVELTEVTERSAKQDLSNLTLDRCQKKNK
ncbi:MAG: DUF2846 domain-containing protein [Bacteroidota bacterium]